MTRPHHVRITSAGSRGSIHVDDHDLSGAVTELEFRWGAGDPLPAVDLTLFLLTGEVDGQDVIVRLPPETCEALVALGWTPPPGGES